MRISAALRVLCVALAAGLGAGAADAQDQLKLAIGQKGNWDTAIPELGTRAGIFKKHGLELELLYTKGGGETQQAVIARSADIGLAAGTLGVMGAFSKGAPVRIIGAQATGAADFWYVRAGLARQGAGGHGGQDHGLFDQRLLDPFHGAGFHREIQSRGAADGDR